MLYEAIVFLPLIGALIAGAVTLLNHKLPVDDGHCHDHAPGHGHGHGHGHDDHGAADAQSHRTGNAHDEPDHADAQHDHDHGHHHEDPPGTKIAQLITTGFMIVGAVLSWVAFIQVGLYDTPAMHLPLFTWIQSGQLNVSWSLRIDTLTVVMLVVVNTVSCLVHTYSIGYMSHDEHKTRFFAYLSFFTFAMLTLVTSDNLLQMFFGWEGVGVASYLLIGFWFQRPTANAAAIKAFVVNRVGDFGFALGIFGVFVMFNTIDLQTIFANAGSMKGKEILFLGAHFDALTCICLLLFMGAMGKSAQFLLHTWLPDAMEGPTPVSALIHAATMVTAGVFMVARLSPLFDNAPYALAFVTFIGATTAFFAATVGLVQNDIKRVIAYSTCSQLGYMFAALGVGSYSAGIFHLFTHAFFKALLFLCAGSVIHAVSGEQDMRKMGGLRRHIPLTYWMMILGTLAITGVGIPLSPLGFAGFNSKDAIIEATYAASGFFAPYAFFMTSVAALFTAFYSWRLIFMTFFGPELATKEVMEHVHESPRVMTVPLMILAVGACFAGMVFSSLFLGYGHEAAHIVETWNDFWKGAIYVNPDNHILTEAHHVPVLVSFTPFIAMLIGTGTAYYFYIVSPETPRRLAEYLPGVYQFLLNKWYFDELYNAIFVRPALWIGRVLWKRGDGTIIDGLGPDGISARVLDITAQVGRLQTGYIFNYAFAMLIGVAAMITWMLLGGVH